MSNLASGPYWLYPPTEPEGPPQDLPIPGSPAAVRTPGILLSQENVTTIQEWTSKITAKSHPELAPLPPPRWPKLLSEALNQVAIKARTDGSAYIEGHRLTYELNDKLISVVRKLLRWYTRLPWP